MKRSYTDNVYIWLKRKGFAPKYERAGIYCIKLDGEIVYIGKSKNMLRRISEHYVGIKTANAGSELKYRLLAEAQHHGYSVDFDALYKAQAHTYSKIELEIGQKEGEYIRQYNPRLNTQIPNEKDWSHFEVRAIDKKAF